jgi:hypothetical protein
MKKIILSFFIFILLINNALALKTFTNIGGNFTIEYPSGWSYSENYDSNDHIFTSQTGHAKIRIIAVPLDGTSLTQIVNNKEKDLKDSNIAFESKSVNINDVSGYEWMYSEYSSEQKNKNKQVILFPAGEKYYIITAIVADYPYSDDQAFYSEDLDRIINSFKVVSKPTTSASISGFEIYEDPEEKFKIKYPSGWKIFKNQGDRYLYIANLYSGSRTGIYLDVLNDIKSNRNLAYIRYNEKNITVNNLKGIEWEFRYTNPAGTFDSFVGKEAVLLFGNKYYVITAFSERDTYPQYSYLFDNIINSFGIIQPSTTAQTPLEAMMTPSPTPKPSANIRPSINLYGQKTNVEPGDDIILILSAVNDFTKPPMHVQLNLIPPSGFSVTSMEFVTAGAGQYTANYTVGSGRERAIEVRIKPNQVGDFEAKGSTVYYYGDDYTNATENTSILPIKVRKIPKTPTPAPTPQSPTLSFLVSLLIFGILFSLLIFESVYKLIKKFK